MRRLGRKHGRRTHRTTRRSFSLVELVIVVVIIGILAAIAVPRYSRATTAATEAYLESTIATVRRGMTMYYAEHDRYPGYNPAGGAADGTWFAKQMLEYSDYEGNTQATFGWPYIYGPYLRPPLPKNPFNDLDTVKVIANPGVVVATGSSGWIAVLSNGDFGVNVADAVLDDRDISTDVKIESGSAGAMSL